MKLYFLFGEGPFKTILTGFELKWSSTFQQFTSLFYQKWEVQFKQLLWNLQDIFTGLHLCQLQHCEKVKWRLLNPATCFWSLRLMKYRYVKPNSSMSSKMRSFFKVCYYVSNSCQIIFKLNKINKTKKNKYGVVFSFWDNCVFRKIGHTINTNRITFTANYFGP